MRRRVFRIADFRTAGIILLLCAGGALGRETGTSLLRVNADGVEIKVYVYRPSACADASVLFVFHGLNRKAAGVRDKAIGIAEDACLMVFAPLFDKDRFPNWRYHRAGVFRDGTLQPRAQ